MRCALCTTSAAAVKASCEATRRRLEWARSMVATASLTAAMNLSGEGGLAAAAVRTEKSSPAAMMNAW